MNANTRETLKQFVEQIEILAQGVIHMVVTNKELEKDKERLDWLDKHFHIMRHCVLEGDDSCDGTYDYDAVFFAGNHNSEPSGDVRLAIDSAMKGGVE